jgi:hypothetical protein
MTTPPAGFYGIVRAVLNPQRVDQIAGTVHTPAGSFHGLLSDRGHAILVWDNANKTATWVDPTQVVAITQDPHRPYGAAN